MKLCEVKLVRPCYGPLFLSRAKRALEKGDHNMGLLSLHNPVARAARATGLCRLNKTWAQKLVVNYQINRIACARGWKFRQVA